MNDSGLDEQRLLAMAGDTVFGRGEEYVRYVRGLQVSGASATGSIQARNVYVVGLDWSAADLAGTCTCPHYAGGAFCKHLVALGLAVIDGGGGDSGDRPGSASTESTIVDAHIDAMAVDDLRALVRDLAARDPAVYRLLEVRASTAGNAEGVADDLVALVRGALSSRGFIDYRRSFEVARDAQEMLDELEGHLAGGGADVVRPALLRAVTRLRTITQQADDSSGSIGDACQRAADLYARSCVEGAPDRTKLAKWLAKFRDDSPGWPHTPLDRFVEAFDEKALGVYRRAVAALDQKYGDKDHWQRFEVDAMLLELADHDGDVDRAVVLLSRREHPEYAAIVERLRSVDRLDEAVAWIDRGVAEGRVSGGPGGRGGFWLDPVDVARTYGGLGRVDDAIAVLRREFERQPGRSTYWKLLDFAAEVERWDGERAWALGVAQLHASRDFGDGSALVEIALAEGDLDGAWTAAKEYGAGAAWQALAQASEETRPVDAAGLYRRVVERDLTHPNTKLYPKIADTLALMRDLHVRGDAGDEFEEYVEAIRAEYGRRTSLMAALDRKGL